MPSFFYLSLCEASNGLCEEHYRSDECKSVPVWPCFWWVCWQLVGPLGVYFSVAVQVAAEQDVEDN